MRNLGATSHARYRQPHHALKPHAFSLEAIEQWALAKTADLEAERFRLSSFWHLDFIIQHTLGDRKTRYTGRLAQSENYGIAFSLTSTIRGAGQAFALDDRDYTLVGEDSRAILQDRRYRTDMDRTALVDLVLGQAGSREDDQLHLDDKRHAKYAHKSRVFADEAERVLRRKGADQLKGRKPHVLVIGAMAGTHAALMNRGFDVTATDMSPDVISQNLGGVTVQDESDNGRLIGAADLVIITGMTLPNRTLPSILEAAKDNNTSTMIWAVTGRNCGHYYIEHGIDSVISDPLPFLMLPGPAAIRIWRREV